MKLKEKSLVTIMNKFKYLLGGCLIVIIIAMVIYIYTNQDTIFRHEVTIVYPDECIEYYVNGELTTPECTEGRELELTNKPVNYGGDITWQLPLNNTEK